jgi:hypothetical protein
MIPCKPETERDLIRILSAPYISGAMVAEKCVPVDGEGDFYSAKDTPPAQFWKSWPTAREREDAPKLLVRDEN